MTDTAAPHLIVALHGAGMNGAVFGPLLGFLGGYDLYTPSFPGHEPLIPAEPLADINAMTDWAQRKIRGRRCILMGHSMGALVAMEAAASEHVDAIILLGAAAKMPVNDILLHAEPADARAMVVKWSVHRDAPEVAAVRGVLSDIMQAPKPEVLRADLAACHAYDHGAPAAAKIDKPVLVLCGDADKMVSPDQSRALADIFPAAQFVTIPDAGHMMMMEKPFETAMEIKKFLDILPR